MRESPPLVDDRALERFRRFAGIPLRPGVEGEEQEVRRVEAGIRALRVLQAAQEEAGADEGDQRKRHLRHHKDVAKAEEGRRPAVVVDEEGRIAAWEPDMNTVDQVAALIDSL